MSIIIPIDTETTGLLPASRILSMAAIAYDTESNQVIDRREWLVNPGMPVPEDVTPINGYTTETVKDGVPAAQALEELFAWIPKRAVLVAHWARYDTGIINWEAGRAGLEIPEGITVIDTCEIAQAQRATKNNKLDTLVAHYGIQRCGESHRAMSDADACMQYYARMKAAGVNGNALLWDLAGHDYRYTADLPGPLTDLPELVANGAPLSFVYVDKDNTTSTRTITPYGWYAIGDSVYFNGWCHLRNARRTFLTTSVLEVTA